MPKVEIFTKVFCPYCVRAMALLEQKGVVAEQIPVDGGGEVKQQMVERAGGRTTVPQIFIDGRHVGGCDALYSLDRSGELDAMLGR